MQSKFFIVSILFAVATISSNIVFSELAVAQTGLEQDPPADNFTVANGMPPTSMNPDLTLANINSDINLNGDYSTNFTNANDTKDWAIISGAWEFTDNGLHGGVPDNASDPINNMILSPFTTSDLSNISTSVRVNQIEEDAINYATIVYSFIDFNNFKSAGIFINNSDVFVRFTNITNGVAIFYPQTELIKTDLQYQPGSFFDFALSLNGKSLDLSVNGTKYHSENSSQFDQNGYIGLSYSRLGNVDFGDFKIEKINSQVAEMTNDVTVRDSNSILLQGYEIPTGDYIHVYDSTPYQIESGHIAVKLPCNDENISDIMVYAGKAPDFQPIVLNLISELSNSDDLCLYHADLRSDSDNPITDIAIQNESPEDIEFPETSSIVLDISRISKIS